MVRTDENSNKKQVLLLKQIFREEQSKKLLREEHGNRNSFFKISIIQTKASWEGASVYFGPRNCIKQGEEGVNANLINTVGSQRKSKEYSCVLALPLPLLFSVQILWCTVFWVSVFTGFCVCCCFFPESQVLGARLARVFTSQRVRKRIFKVLKSI